jgi:hypothetical protein
MPSKVLITVLLLSGLLPLSLCQPGPPLDCGGLGFGAGTMPSIGKLIRCHFQYERSHNYHTITVDVF